MSIAPILEELSSTADQILQRLHTLEQNAASKLPAVQLSELTVETISTEQESVEKIQRRLWEVLDANKQDPFIDIILGKTQHAIDLIKKLNKNRVFCNTYIDLNVQTMQALRIADAISRTAELQSLHKQALLAARKSLLPNNALWLEGLISLTKISSPPISSVSPEPNPIDVDTPQTPVPASRSKWAQLFSRPNVKKIAILFISLLTFFFALITMRKDPKSL